MCQGETAALFVPLCWAGHEQKHSVIGNLGLQVAHGERRDAPHKPAVNGGSITGLAG